ncbi:PhnD/SsuA/transferrin family substrate-binding protein [Actomonas aquatica]|uniref:PhnD/SsuA/transferrin family substrate-binding protein n=1 Tax=Actomonas aquatica TaxID=2866162 RepID=A0ABZ1C818_9BACT|nr:PhnD/SsuA/transferrin family substrate-binding protein [Opitutus sp. WL0086]WRQ86445.1 PhnD/SsuA/transferrin family substrate-binding protein [Opitutus sp. WL0086]
MNVNDAQAAIRVWANSFLENQQFQLSTDISILDGVPKVLEALRAREIDAISVTTREFWELRPQIEIGQILLGTTEGIDRQTFAVWVRRDRGIENLADLRGGHLKVWRSSRTGLAEPWLEVELETAGLGGGAGFWGHRSETAKLSQAVLPVFFGQAEACLVTRRGMELMTELNPQLGRDLVEVVVSEPMVASLMFFRASFEREDFPAMVEALNRVADTPEGAQLFMLFQQTGLTEGEESDLATGLDLLDRYEALRTKREAAAAAPMMTGEDNS